MYHIKHSTKIQIIHIVWIIIPPQKKGKEKKSSIPFFGVEGLDLWTPKEARLQLALLPSITGAASTQALMAASGSRKVTWNSNNINSIYHNYEKTRINKLFFSCFFSIRILLRNPLLDLSFGSRSSNKKKYKDSIEYVE